ncbi:MAG TPA: hypothetical protein VKT30_17305 [Caulobacteraceae bacterium]|nr:hypothetical protein [Caulobacteraceae bacterium]
MKPLLIGAAFAAAMAPRAGAAAPPPDGFAAFYKLFAAAAAKDDQKTLASLTVLSAGLDPDVPITFAGFHAHYLTAKERRCLATGKPERAIDGTGAATYSVFCGHLIYVFSKPSAAGWRLTDLSPDD